MSILGIDRITYGVADAAACRKFFLDWGLKLVHESGEALDFETLNGCEVHVRGIEDPTLPPAIEDGPTLREVVWGVESRADIDRLRAALGADAHYAERYGTLHATDPNGLALAFRVTHKRKVDLKGMPMNAWGQPGRGVNRRSTFYERAEPIEVGHVVFFTDQLAELERFYVAKLGFAVSDRYPGRGVFLRCAPEGGHHDLFLNRRSRSAGSITWPSRCATSTRSSAAGCTSRAAAGRPRSVRGAIRSPRRTSGT
jgi:catechol 2,3-dioxygenase-like lactoylglutathione lyase family enzyme